MTPVRKKRSLTETVFGTTESVNPQSESVFTSERLRNQVKSLGRSNASVEAGRARHSVRPGQPQNPTACTESRALPPSLTGDRNASNPCNSADSSPVYILRPGASGRVPAGRLDRTRVPPGNQGGEERRRLQIGLQQACNLPATSLQPWRHSGVTLVVLCVGPVPGEPPGDAENGQLCWTLPWQY